MAEQTQLHHLVAHQMRYLGEKLTGLQTRLEALEAQKEALEWDRNHLAAQLKCLRAWMSWEVAYAAKENPRMGRVFAEDQRVIDDAPKAPAQEGGFE